MTELFSPESVHIILNVHVCQNKAVKCSDKQTRPTAITYLHKLNDICQNPKLVL